MNLKPLVDEVVQARYEVEKYQVELENYLKQHPEIDTLQDRIKQAKDKLITLESSLREQAVQVYEQTKEKHPVSGVEIKLVKTVIYQEKTAESWARKHAELVPAALKFNRTGYEKALKNGDIPDMPGAVVEVPKAYISSKLNDNAE